METHIIYNLGRKNPEHFQNPGWGNKFKGYSRKWQQDGSNFYDFWMRDLCLSLNSEVYISFQRMQYGHQFTKLKRYTWNIICGITNFSCLVNESFTSFTRHTFFFYFWSLAFLKWLSRQSNGRLWHYIPLMRISLILTSILKNLGLRPKCRRALTYQRKFGVIRTKILCRSDMLSCTVQDYTALRLQYTAIKPHIFMAITGIPLPLSIFNDCAHLEGTRLNISSFNHEYLTPNFVQLHFLKCSVKISLWKSSRFKKCIRCVFYYSLLTYTGMLVLL